MAISQALIDDYKSLVEQMSYYSRCYYNESNSIITDEEYDALFDKLQQIETTHPEIILPNSPTQRVGADISRTEKHVYPMYSLNKVYDTVNLDKFINKVSDQGNTDYLVDEKMDGCSVELIYVRGQLVNAITRGDGVGGVKVIKTALLVPNIPSRILPNELTVVRGEIMILKNEFNALNIRLENEKRKPYSTMRNCASGILQCTEPNEETIKSLHFYAWELIAPYMGTHDRYDDQQILLRMGFSIPDGTLCKTRNEVVNEIARIDRDRDSRPYGIDGVVVKVNNKDLAVKLGFTNHAPRFATAWKFMSKATVSTVKNIVWHVGRTGRLVPVAEIKPIVIGGATITKVNLHNSRYVLTNKLGIGARIEVARAGDVVPKVSQVLTPVEPKLPETCPICGKPLISTEVDLICSNHNCPGILEAIIANLLNTLARVMRPKSRNAEAEELVKSGTVTKLSDCFVPMKNQSKKLKQERLDELVKLFRSVSLVDLITALGINALGRAAASRLAMEVLDLPTLIKYLEQEDLLAYAPIGETIKQNLKDWYAIPEHKTWLAELVKLKLKELNRC